MRYDEKLIILIQYRYRPKLSPKLIWSPDSRLCGSVDLMIHYRHLIFVEQMQITYVWSFIDNLAFAGWIDARHICLHATRIMRLL